MRRLYGYPSTQPTRWLVIFASLMPLWLLAYAVMAEGFPRPAIPFGLAVAAFVSSLLINLALIWLRWSTIEVVLYGFLPFWFLPIFDEISTVYKTPFIILCTILLSIGRIGHQSSRSTGLRWLSLLVAMAAMMGAASLLADHYWKLVDVGGYAGCYPECLPSPDQGHHWWSLLFNF